MKRAIFFLAMVLLTAATIAGTSGNASAATCNGTFTGLTPNLANGQSLVAANGNCTMCHGAPTGASAATIYSWASNMSFMSTWTCQNFVDVAAALAPAPATCTSFTYSAWGACQSNNTQTRTVASSSPTGCTGGSPVLSQSCTYVPPVTACTSFTYSAWGACQSNNTQTRTVASSSPSECTGGSPVLSQSCTYVPPVTACTSFTYSAWGACQSNNTQTRTVASSSPTGCTGGSPVLSQSCTYVPPVTACTSFTYSAWGACQSNNTQTRTVASSSPTGCTGGSPVLSQSCTYVPPTSGSVMPLPTVQDAFTYDPVAASAPSADPTQTMPIGVGAVATGGSTLTLHVTASFKSPVNLYLTMYTPSAAGFTPTSVKMLGSTGTFGSLYMNNGVPQLRKWKSSVTAVDQTVINNVQLSQLQPGMYYVVLTATPTTGSNYYQWVTYFIVPSGTGSTGSDD
jgi:hypothetical protein